MDKLEKTIDDINKRFGDGTIFKLGAGALEIPRISSGSIKIDIITGGGIPIGRMTEIYGPEMSSKSTLCQHIIAEAQKAGYQCLYVDGEQSLEISYAKACGINADELFISQPNCLEDALEITQKGVEQGMFVVFDSTNALPPKAELSGDMGDRHVGLAARLMAQACRKLNPLLKDNNTSIIWVSQIRSKIGVIFGSPEVVGVGNALKFAASVRIDLRISKTQKVATEAIANIVKVKIKKNKTAPPFQTCEIDVFYGEGIDKCGEIRDLGMEIELVTKSGSHFSVTDPQTGEIVKKQGRIQFAQELRKYPELVEYLENEIKTHYLTD